MSAIGCTGLTAKIGVTLRAPRPIAESGRLPRDNKATGLGILSLTETRHIQGRASYMTHFSFSKFLLYKAAPTGNPVGAAKYSRDLVKMKSVI